MKIMHSVNESIKIFKAAKVVKITAKFTDEKLVSVQEAVSK